MFSWDCVSSSKNNTFFLPPFSKSVSDDRLRLPEPQHLNYLHTPTLHSNVITKGPFIYYPTNLIYIVEVAFIALLRASIILEAL